jgi:hypothetical protein
MYREYPAQVLVVTAEQEIKDGNHAVRKASSSYQLLMYWPAFSAKHSVRANHLPD